MRTVATAVEMRELLNMGVLEEYNVGPNWVSFAGAPQDTHIRWNSEGFGFIYGSEAVAEAVREWVQDQIHLDND